MLLCEIRGTESARAKTCASGRSVWYVLSVPSDRPRLNAVRLAFARVCSIAGAPPPPPPVGLKTIPLRGGGRCTYNGSYLGRTHRVGGRAGWRAGEGDDDDGTTAVAAASTTAALTVGISCARGGLDAEILLLSRATTCVSFEFFCLFFPLFAHDARRLLFVDTVKTKQTTAEQRLY